MGHRHATPRAAANRPTGSGSSAASAARDAQSTVRGVLLLAAAGMTGVTAAVSTTFARRVVTPSLPDESVRVGVVSGESDESHVWLSGPDTGLPGRYSALLESGATHVRVGAVRDRREFGGQEWVLRDLVAIDRGELRPGMRGRITGWWYSDPAALGLSWQRVRIPLPGGDSWGWEFGAETEAAWAETPRGTHWAIHVHGRGAQPEETLRGVVAASESGLRSVVLAYRNDTGAPHGHRNRYGLGLAESLDLDAAIEWVRCRGAESITVFGWSMGGAAALLSATRGPHRNLINALVLDSPAVAWRSILRRQAELARLPRITGDLGYFLLRRGWVAGGVPDSRGTDLSLLDPEPLAAALRIPVLVHASAGDSFVPWGGVLELARLRPDLLELRAAPGEHVKLWNVDADGWHRSTLHFLRRLAATRTVD